MIRQQPNVLDLLFGLLFLLALIVAGWLPILALAWLLVEVF